MFHKVIYSLVSHRQLFICLDRAAKSSISSNRTQNEFQFFFRNICTIKVSSHRLLGPNPSLTFQGGYHTACQIYVDLDVFRLLDSTQGIEIDICAARWHTWILE